MNGALMAWLWIVVAGVGQAGATGDAQDSTVAPPVGVVEAGGGLAELLALVPSDPAAVLVVPRMDRFDERLLGVAAPYGLPSGLSIHQYLKSTLELVAGIEPKGAAAVVFLKGVATGEAVPRFLLIVPASDSAAVMTFLSPAPVDAGVMQVRLRGRESFAAVRGRFVVFGPDRASVSSDATSGFGEQLTLHQRETLADSDVSLFVTRAAVTAAGWDRAGTALISFALGLSGDDALDRPIQWSARLKSDGVHLLWLRQGRGGGGAEAGCAAPRLLTMGTSDVGLALGVEASLDEEGYPADVVGQVVLSAVKELALLSEDRADELGRRTGAIFRDVCEIQLAVSAPGKADEAAGWSASVRTRGDAAEVVQEMESWVSFVNRRPFQVPELNNFVERLDVRSGVEQVDGRPNRELVVAFSEPVAASAASSDTGRNRRASTRVLARWAAIAKDTILVTGGDAALFEAVLEWKRSRVDAARGTDSSPAPRDSRARWVIRVHPRRLRHVVQQAATAFGGSAPEGELWNMDEVLEAALERSVSRDDELRLFLPGRLLGKLWGASSSPARDGSGALPEENR